MDECIGTQKFFISGLPRGFDRLSKQDLTVRVASAEATWLLTNLTLDPSAIRVQNERVLAIPKCWRGWRQAETEQSNARPSRALTSRPTAFIINVQNV